MRIHHQTTYLRCYLRPYTVRKGMTDKVSIKVFVTTEGAIEAQGYGYGKFFELSDFDSHQDFSESAEVYARWQIGDRNPKMAFLDFEGSLDYLLSFDKYNLMTRAAIKPSVWQLLKLEQKELVLLDAYLAANDLIEGSFSTTLDVAKETLIGVFETDEELARHVHKAILDSLPASLLNNIDMKKAGADLAKTTTHAKNHYFSQ